jgi:DNA-binding NtrC family response regulator
MSPGSVLIVEDEQDIRDVLAEMIEMFGYRAALLENGLDAWNRISVENFDVVVTDLGLPGMNGIDLLKKMRAHDIDIPVLIITGVGFESKLHEFTGFLSWDYLQKPFKMNDLKEKLSKLAKSRIKGGPKALKRH